MLMQSPVTIDRSVLIQRFLNIRGMSRRLCESLTTEDCCIQSMPEVSPTRWHLAHTTWFFEEFVLDADSGYQPRHPEFACLFNSYYNSVGKPFPRAERGLLSRPTLAEVWEYRQEIDHAIVATLEQLTEDRLPAVASVVELGLQHEQQHQELMLTDIKHVFSKNPLYPRFRPGKRKADAAYLEPLGWCDYPEGVFEIGASTGGFVYDNETPRHRVFLEPFALADRLVTAGEYLTFMEDGGYESPQWWLSEGWDLVNQCRWKSPLYWLRSGGQWQEFTLAGLQSLDRQRPVCHVSYFEADAFARWSDARLPTEAEWEVAAELCQGLPAAGGFIDFHWEHDTPIHPTAAVVTCKPAQLLGDAWEWTSSAYAPYPGYRPLAGALGEYNGKFMCNQYVLRGGSCASAADHLRITYRNFFPASTRWQFSGIRLANSR